MKQPRIGDRAPDFKGKDQDGEVISLTDYKGRKLLLYFYPKDSTSGCTAEACSLRDGYDELLNLGYEVLGVSVDSEVSHLKFAEKNKLPFRLLSDTDKSVVTAYGVWGEKKFMGKTYMGTIRTTFLIDENGIIEDIITKVQTKDHANQILNLNK